MYDMYMLLCNLNNYVILYICFSSSLLTTNKSNYIYGLVIEPGTARA